MKRSEDSNRQYIRLNTVFPVEFHTVDDIKNPTSSMLQGFTRDVGKGGMCIEVKSMKGEVPFNIVPGTTKVKLFINIPSDTFPTECYAIVRWVKKISEYVFDTYSFGCNYDEIEPDNQKMIERHVVWLQKKPKIVFIFTMVILAIAILLLYFGIRA
jgi:c-di-GMP-binding flagellar brake protein YcgR